MGIYTGELEKGENNYWFWPDEEVLKKGSNHNMRVDGDMDYMWEKFRAGAKVDLEFDVENLQLTGGSLTAYSMDFEQFEMAVKAIHVNLKDAVSRLKNEKKLEYDKRVVKEFLGAMFTNQIIILSGAPGTGKSSLPPAIADVIGAKCEIISVQPNWTDNQDLLGYYNPVGKRYMATPFVDILIDAEKNKDENYIICLDEMNLATVEYYFSEILSAMETKDRTLRLYSEYLEDELHDKRYPAKFNIPENVQFVGTLNMDESTKNLSPKVLDRSYVIEVGEAGTDSDKEIDESETVKLAREMRYEDKILTDLEELIDKLNKLKPGEQNDEKWLEFSWSKRVQKQAKKLMARGLDIEDVLLGKILPTMKAKETEHTKYGKSFDGLFEELLQIFQDEYKYVSNKLERMRDKDLDVLNYWR